MKPAVSNSGFTLISLVIAMLLMVILLTTAGTLFSFGVKSYRINMDRIEVQENLRIGLDRMSRELRHSTAVLSIDNSGTGRLNFSAVEPSLPSVNNVITYRIGISGDYESASQLLRAVNGAGNNPIARYVTSLRVEPENNSADNRTYHLTVTGSKGDSGSFSLSTTVTIRNG